MRVARFGDRDVRPAQRCAGGCRHLPREADDGQGVAPVGLDVDVQDHVADERLERDAEGRAGGQDEDAVGVGREAQLVAGAEHALALHSGQPGGLDVPVPGQHGADERHGYPLTDRDVGRAAHDRQRWLCRRRRVTVVSDRRLELGCLSDGQQLADHDPGPAGAHVLDALDLHAQERQPVGEGLR